MKLCANTASALVTDTPEVQWSDIPILPDPVPVTATPEVRWSEIAILFDHGFAQAPRPTPTALVLSLAIHPPGSAYGGNGTLSVTQGGVSLFNDAACNQPVVLPAVFSAAELLAGVTLHALGSQAGNTTVQLALDNATGVNVAAPATDTAEVIELTLDAEEFAPAGLTLTAEQRIDRGKIVGLPPAQGHSHRAAVTPHRTGGVGDILLTDASGANGLALRESEWDAGVDKLNQHLTNGTRYWLEGLRGPANPTAWLHLGLQLASGTILDCGDSLLVRRVNHPANSVGYEWEVNSMALERVVKPSDGPPSKARIYQCPRAAMSIDTEVDTELNAFGEFVLGPARSFADVENQIGEVRNFWNAVQRHGTVFVAVPAAIPHQGGGNFMNAGDYCRVASAETGGTGQASFAVPLWLLPCYLALHDNADGLAAKHKAEQHAQTDIQIDEAAIGLICACEYYVLKYEGVRKLNEDDGPKVLAAVMMRTDFHAMYATLGAASQAAFGRWVRGHGKRGTRLLPNGYSTGEGGFQPRGPQIGEWLDSIVLPAPPRTKDLMSPPPGFPPHHENPLIPYAMGKYGIDPNSGNVITEYRGWAGSIESVSSFCGKALQWARLNRLPGIQTWNNDGTPPLVLGNRAGRAGSGKPDTRYL